MEAKQEPPTSESRPNSLTARLAGSAKAKKPVLIVPDKDADGLTAGAILRHTLLLLGVPQDLISIHTLTKGNNIHSQDEREKMAAKSPSYIFIIDQGSRPGPSIIDGEHIGLIIDHHHATEDDFPAGSDHVRIEGCSNRPDC